MKTISAILYGLILCMLIVFTVKFGRPDMPQGMVLIPAGDGTDAFYMDVYEVTNIAYKKFVDANPQWQKDKVLTTIVGNNYLSLWNGNMYPKGKGNHPVTGISWFAAKAYAEWVGKDLPTEAQWEKAARGKLVEKKYPWGDVVPENRANYDRYTHATDFRNPPTKEVGSYLPNEYGLYDIAGNVAEWCLDRLDIDDIHGRYHKTRGGSWFDDAKGIQIATKSHYPADDTVVTLGFRCVLPIREIKSAKVSTELASWLYDEMRGQYDNAFYDISKGFMAHADLDAKLDDIVSYNTGYPRTFEKELIRVFREVEAERMVSGDTPPKDTPSEGAALNDEQILRLWRLYLEIHFEHNNESVFRKLRLFQESVRVNADSIIMQSGH